jgi:hypothetical protein
VPWFAFAFVAALVTNLALLGSSGKQVFGHYVTNLLPFVFVAYASLGRALVAASPRVRALALVGALVFCLGGVEATLSISRNVDGRIGLEVHRRTLAIIRADGERDGNASEPVRLDFGYRSNLYDWHMFATRAMDMPIHFETRGEPRASRRYRLTERDAAPPRNAIGEAIDVGYARLYRVR